jgi:hypothetical protein
MRLIRPRRPSPAMIVALVAVVLVAGGTATAALTGKDKKSVKTIADREIIAQAGNLSVASARNATNATSASTASNANLLAGTPADGFVASFAGHASDSDVNKALFTVPQLQVTLETNSSAASASFFRVRNDSNANLDVSDPVLRNPNSQTIPVFTVAGGATSPDEGGGATPPPGQMVMTSHAHPDFVLLFGCFEGQSNETYCYGQLLKAPAR